MTVVSILLIIWFFIVIVYGFAIEGQTHTFTREGTISNLVIHGAFILLLLLFM